MHLRCFIACLVLVTLGGCEAGAAEQSLPRWILDAPGSDADGAVEVPVRLGERLPDRRSTYSLRTSVEIDPALRGRDVDLRVPYFPANVTLRVDGEPIAPLHEEMADGYRHPGPQAWRIPGRLTDAGEIELEMEVEHTFTQSAWLDVVPRLVPAGVVDGQSLAVRWVNRFSAVVAVVALLTICVIYLGVFLADRSRPAYFWFALQAITASSYPLFVSGYSQYIVGIGDTMMLAFMLSSGPIVSIWFTHSHYDLRRPSRAWLLLLGIVFVAAAVFHDPFVSTQVLGKLASAVIVATVVYQLYVLGRLALGRPSRRGARILLAAWVLLGVMAVPDLISWTGLGEPLGGVRLACPALAVFAVLQALHLGREHIHSLRQSDELNVELGARVELLENRQREIEQLNRELRRQVGERSERLLTALSMVAGRESDLSGLRAGELIEDRYRVVRSIGRGGMGSVYEVERVADGRRLALKVALESRGVALARLAREAQIAARIEHPNVVSILDVDVSESGFLYIVMELIDGPSLRERRDRWGDVAWALPVMTQVARGLAALHEQGIVHRDLKPTNVLLLERSGSSPQAKITDFGISRLLVPSSRSNPESTDPTLTRPTVRVRGEAGGGGDTSAPTSPSPSSNLTETGLLSGTPSYMAPELADDPSLLAPSSDVFSLGLVAHLVLTGEPAFDEPPLLRALRAAEPETPRSLGERVPPLAPSTVELLMRCLSHEPADRPSAGEVAVVLDDGLAG